MKRFLLLLALLTVLAACLVLTASAQGGTATFYHNGTAVASVPRGSDGTVVLPSAPDTGTRKFIGWVVKDASGNEALHAAGAAYNGAAGDLRFDALTVELYTAGGAAVSYNEPSILRFDGIIPMADHQRLVSLAGVNNVSFGMLIAPYSGTNGKAFDRASAPLGTLDRETTAFLYTTEEWGVFSGKSNEIANSALLEKYCGRAYLTVRIGSTAVTVYADYDTAKHTRSVYGVTAAAFMERAGTASTAYPHLTDAGCYSRYDGTQLSALRGRLDRVVYVSVLDEGSVQSKYSCDNYTFHTFDCLSENGKPIHTLYTSPYKVERVIRNDPTGHDTYVITGKDGADFRTVTAYYIGGSYRAPSPSEWREDGIYISVEQPKN